MSKLSTLLKEARAQSGLTQEQLAKKAANGLTAHDVSRAERALDVPTDAQLKAIAKVTGVTQKSLLDAAKPPKTRSWPWTCSKARTWSRATPPASARSCRTAFPPAWAGCWRP